MLDQLAEKRSLSEFSRQFLIKKVEGLRKVKSDELLFITDYIGREALDRIQSKGIQIYVPKKFRYTERFYKKFKLREPEECKVFDRLNFSFFEGGRKVDVLCSTSRKYSRPFLFTDTYLTEGPKKTVRIDFSFQNDTLIADLIDKFPKQLVNFLSNNQLMQLDKRYAREFLLVTSEGKGLWSPGLSFLRSMREIISRIDTNCTIQLVASDKQRKELYELFAKTMKNIVVDTPDEAKSREFS